MCQARKPEPSKLAIVEALQPDPRTGHSLAVAKRRADAESKHVIRSRTARAPWTTKLAMVEMLRPDARQGLSLDVLMRRIDAEVKHVDGIRTAYAQRRTRAASAPWTKSCGGC